MLHSNCPEMAFDKTWWKSSLMGAVVDDTLIEWIRRNTDKVRRLRTKGGLN